MDHEDFKAALRHADACNILQYRADRGEPKHEPLVSGLIEVTFDVTEEFLTEYRRVEADLQQQFVQLAKSLWEDNPT